MKAAGSRETHLRQSRRTQATAQRQHGAATAQPPSLGASGATADSVDTRFQLRLEEWRRDAGEGIMLMADADLQKQIDAIKHFDYDAWGQTLLGNLMGWVAPVFKGAKIAIQLAGIITKTPAPHQNKKDTTLVKIESRMLDYLDGLLADRADASATLAQQVVTDHPGIGLDEAVGLCLADQFKPEFLMRASDGHVSGLNGGAIRETYRRVAADKLTRFRAEIEPALTDPGPLGHGYIRIEGVGLALARYKGDNWFFVEYVSRDMHDEAMRIAAEQYKRQGGWWRNKGEGPLAETLSGLGLGGATDEWVPWTPEQPIPVLKADEVVDMPSASM